MIGSLIVCVWLAHMNRTPNNVVAGVCLIPIIYVFKIAYKLVTAKLHKVQKLDGENYNL